MSEQSRHFFVQGRVQGVWYRSWCQETAQSMGLTGFVRNRQNGQVEVYAVGTPEKLDAFVLQCQKGPLLARVDKILPAPALEQVSDVPTDRFDVLATK